MGNQTKNHSSGWTQRNLSDDQIAQIVEKANVNPNLWDLRDIAKLLTNTGLRRRELDELRWSGVDMAKSRIFVQTVNCYGGRYVPFDSRGAEALESLRQRRPGSELVLGDDAPRLWTRCVLQLKNLTAELGIPCVGLHDFRRAAISRGVASGIAFNTLSRRFAFSGPTSIERHCLNSDADAKHVSRIREKVQALFPS